MKVQTEVKDQFTIIRLEGRMNISFVQEIESEYLQNVNSAQTANLLVDIERVDYISSSALRLFVSTLKICKEKKIRLVLTGLNSSAKKIFELVEMNSMFEIKEKVKDVIQ